MRIIFNAVFLGYNLAMVNFFTMYFYLKLKDKKMAKYKCKTCGHIYDEAKGDPKSGIAAGTVWADVPDDWECPNCGAAKVMFTQMR